MKNIFNLNGKTVLIIGASSGLGMRFAKTLSEAGARIILAARRANILESLAKNLGNSISIKLDISNKIEIKDAFAFLEKSGEKIDICVNNAGIAKSTYVFEPATDCDFEQLIE